MQKFMRYMGYKNHRGELDKREIYIDVTVMVAIIVVGVALFWSMGFFGGVV